MSRILIVLLFYFQQVISVSCAFAQGSGGNITIVAIDPLEKILKEQTYFHETGTEVNVARGEHASFQFLFRNSNSTKGLSVSASPIFLGLEEQVSVKISYVDYVKNGRTTPSPSRDRIFSASGYYPDPLIPVSDRDIPAFDNQPAWISIEIPKNARPGKYSGLIIFSGTSQGREFTISKEITINVYNVAIDKSSLWITNWWFTGSQQLRLLNNGNDILPYSEQYWEVIKLFATNMKEYRQNVVMISPIDLTKFSQNGRTYAFDFTNFDKTVEIFIKYGAIKRIEGGHLGGRISGWDGPFGLSIPILKNDTNYIALRTISEPAVKEFYKQFISALTSHLNTKGWTSMYMQHIADEPIESNIESYKEISSFIHSLMPGMPVIEANHASSLAGSIDVWVPQLNFLKENYKFYQDQQKEGKEVWFYTCLAPQGNYANRFVELPLIQTRLLHWINYRFGITGYLHWGLNYWDSDPYGDVSGIIEVSCNVLPGGDTHIVYPGFMRLNSSIRLEAMRDGICDYELLKMLEKKNPEKAKSIAGAVVAGFDLYDCNIKAFREKRKQILELLSQ